MNHFMSNEPETIANALTGKRSDAETPVIHGTRMPAADAYPDVLPQAADVIDAAALPNSRHELFAQHVAAGLSLADSYRSAGYSDTSDTAVRAHSSRLAATYPVQARIRALREAAAERAEISIASRMAWLDSVVHADAGELSRVVTCPCPHCWEDAAYARATQLYLASLKHGRTIAIPGHHSAASGLPWWPASARGASAHC